MAARNPFCNFGGFGAIGEEVKASRNDYHFDDESDGGVLLASPCTSSDSAESLRELVEDSEPLVHESPRAARLLAANKNNFYFEDSAARGSPESHRSARSNSTAFNFMLAPSPEFSLGQIQPTQNDKFEQIPRSFHTRDRSETAFSTVSTASSSSSGFDQKSYKELFNNINDKINLVTRQYVGLDLKACITQDQLKAFIDLAARHVNYRKVAMAIIEIGHLQSPLVHGMIWRLINDLIFDIPLLDQARSRHSGAFLQAWNADVGCCTIQADDWSIKGPLMAARVNAARRVFESTPKFNDFIKKFAAAKTDEIVDKLHIAWRKGMMAQARDDLLDPITKLVRVAIRMRSETKAFEFKFYEYACKGSSNHMVLHPEYPSMPFPTPSQDEDHFVICTKTPQVFEKDYRPQTKAKDTIYKAEVLAREKYPGYLDNLGERYRRVGGSSRGRGLKVNTKVFQYTV